MLRGAAWGNDADSSSWDSATTFAHEVEGLRRKMLCVPELRDQRGDSQHLAAAKAEVRGELSRIEGTQFFLCELSKVVMFALTGHSLYLRGAQTEETEDCEL